MATKSHFKSALAVVTYVFKSGALAVFTNGNFYTSNTKEVAELKEESEIVGSMISYVGEVDEESLDPLNEVKKQAIADYLASTAQALNKENDRGVSIQSLTDKFSNTSKLDEGSLGSSITTKA